MREKNGPHQSGRSGTALDPSRNDSPPVTSDDSENAIATQGIEAANRDEGASSPAATPVYDSGWSTRSGFSVRVRWYGMPDDGRRRRWLTDLLSRAARDVQHD